MFPPIESADEDGFLGWGGDLSPETLRLSYSSGIFPWPGENTPILWFAPPQRAILRFDELHIGARLRRYARQNPFEIRVNTRFEAVIRECAAPRAGEKGTWITPAMQRAYLKLHRDGNAHCVETWRDGKMVGGLYGVSLGAYFCGESMFAREDNASKIALLWLVGHLKSRGASWLDCQMMTPHFAAFGAREIERAAFMEMLDEAKSREVELFAHL